MATEAEDLDPSKSGTKSKIKRTATDKSSMRAGLLTVKLKNAKGIKEKSHHFRAIAFGSGKSNRYAQLTLGDNSAPIKNTLQVSEIIKNAGPNPVWNQTFLFEIDIRGTQKSVLRITLLDEQFGKDDFLGDVTIVLPQELAENDNKISNKEYPVFSRQAGPAVGSVQLSILFKAKKSQPSKVENGNSKSGRTGGSVEKLAEETGLLTIIGGGGVVGAMMGAEALGSGAEDAQAAEALGGAGAKIKFPRKSHGVATLANNGINLASNSQLQVDTGSSYANSVNASSLNTPYSANSTGVNANYSNANYANPTNANANYADGSYATANNANANANANYANSSSANSNDADGSSATANSADGSYTTATYAAASQAHNSNVLDADEAEEPFEGLGESEDESEDEGGDNKDGEDEDSSNEVSEKMQSDTDDEDTDEDKDEEEDDEDNNDEEDNDSYDSDL